MTISADEVSKGNTPGIEVKVSTKKPNEFKPDEFYWVHLFYRFSQLKNNKFRLGKDSATRTATLAIWHPHLTYGEKTIRFVDRLNNTKDIKYQAQTFNPQFVSASDIPSTNEFGDCTKTGFVGDWILAKGNAAIYWIHWEQISRNQGFYNTNIETVKGKRLKGKADFPAFLKVKELMFGYKEKDLKTEVKTKNPFI